MTPDILREAAGAIRRDWQRDGDYWEGRPSRTQRVADTWVAVADWLEVTARDVGTSSLSFHAALTVARAYLGGDA